MNIEGLKILLVEDDESLLEVLSMLLQSKGAIVTEAINGKHAWDLFHKESFDLVLSDIQMPEVDGIELLAKIRGEDPKQPVFLFITGQSRLNESESIALGASGLLEKPFRINTLVDKINVVLRPVA